MIRKQINQLMRLLDSLKALFVRSPELSASLADSGDIIAVKGNSFNSWVIKIFTLSPWTHVGLLCSKDKVFEVNVENAYIKNTGVQSDGGVNVVELSRIMENGGQVYIFKRPSKLSQGQLISLSKHIANERQHKNHYSKLKAANSANIPIVNSISILVGIILITCSCWFLWFAMDNVLSGIKTEYAVHKKIWFSNALDSFYFSVGLLVEVFFILFVIRPIVIKLIVSKPFDNYFLKLGINEKYITDPHGEFCSNAVLSAIKIIDSAYTFPYTKQHQPRPKDIVKLCVNAKFDCYRLIR